MSRNLGTIHVGEAVGFDTVASFWRRLAIGTPPRGFPSITLGVFELTPLEVATAYTLFTNGGSVRPLRGVEHVEAQGKTFTPPEAQAEAGHAARRHLPRDQHDAQRDQRRHRRRRARRRVRRTTRRARPAPPTTCATRGSWASRRRCSPSCGWATTTTSRWASAAPRRRCPSGPSS